VRGRRFVLVVAAVALCAWCGWVSAFHRTSVSAEISWVVSLAAVVAVDVVLRRGRTRRRLGWHLEPVADPWPRPGRGGAGAAWRGTAPWLVLILVALAWDVLGIDTGPHRYHLTISALAQAYRPLNAALLMVWMLVGIGYEAARVRAPLPELDRRATAATRPPDPGASPARCAGLLAAAPAHAVSGSPALLLPNSPPVGVAFWVAVPLVALLVDLAARRSDGRVATAEEFVRFISTNPVANVALMVAWAFAGYHLFAR
jgi:hypothetical protein